MDEIAAGRTAEALWKMTSHSRAVILSWIVGAILFGSLYITITASLIRGDEIRAEWRRENRHSFIS